VMEQFVPSVGLSARVANIGVGEALPPVRLRKLPTYRWAPVSGSPGIWTFPLAAERPRGPRGPPTCYPFPGEMSPFVTIQEEAMPGSGR
jgi:hypothetical protein